MPVLRQTKVCRTFISAATLRLDANRWIATATNLFGYFREPILESSQPGLRIEATGNPLVERMNEPRFKRSSARKQFTGSVWVRCSPVLARRPESYARPGCG